MSDSTGQDSLVAIVPEKASQLVGSIQEGVSSVFDRISSGEPVTSIVKEGFNSSLNPRNIYAKFFDSQTISSSVRGTMGPSLFSLDNGVFKTVALTTGLLGVKLILNSEFTVLNRIQRKVFSTPEDIVAFGGNEIKTNDEVVERIRRMHLNDIENFVPFCLLSNMYVATDPSDTEVKWICGLFLVTRLGHTMTYIGMKNQPWRFYTFLGGCAVNGYLASRLLYALLSR
uniref:Microsomal glutathione S-transferase 1 n=1 Tax=Tigriopus kingsejongensis TaxID=1133412 RepID=A0A1L3THV6_9MAXI|nr:microsomal GST 1 [Tigriopus kingsejongensis]